MGNGLGHKAGILLPAILAAAAALISCRGDSDFESPYLPGSPGYAGDEWTRDGNGNGLADSLEKYSPGCKLPPKTCLDNAKTIAGISGSTNSLIAHDMLLWLNDPGQAPSLVWTPEEGAVRGYILSSSDTSKVKVRDGRLLAAGAGNAQISVTVPGVDSLSASFIAKVVSGGARVASVAVEDLSMLVGRDTTPHVLWSPSDAAYRDFDLVSDKPEVARVVGQKIRGLAPGKASMVLETMDGARKTAFSVTVKEAPAIVLTNSVTAENMFLVVGGEPEAPQIHWNPEKVSDKHYGLLSLDSLGVIDLDADRTHIVAKKTGKAQVVLMAQDGSRKGCDFTVTVAAEAVPVQGIEPSNLSLIAGSDPVLPALAWFPPDATNRKYSLSTGDPAVAQVDGGMIIPLAMGMADLIVSTLDGGFQKTFTVTVGRGDTSTHVDSVRVQNLSVPVGSGKRPVIAWFPAAAGNQGFTLASEDEGIAIPAGENVLAMKAGTVNFTLTALDGGHRANFTVTVYQPETRVQEVHADSMWLLIGDSKAPVLTWTPSTATNLNYTLVSMDSGVASIVNGTQVHGKSVGNAMVQILSASGPSNIFPVSVSAQAVKLNSIQAGRFTMNVGDQRLVEPVFSPSNASNKAFTLKVQTGSASVGVDTGNRATALAAGVSLLAVISDENPNIVAICTVTVVAQVKSVSAKNDTLRLGAAEKDASALLTWVPANASDKRFSLKSSDTSVVRTNGKFYKAMGGGKATLTVTALDGSGKSAIFTVVVLIPVTKVTGKDYTMKTTDSLFSTNSLVTFTPSNASNRNWFLTYVHASDSGKVRIVDGWQLLAKAPGTVPLVLTADDNQNIKDTLAITVIRPVTGLTASPVTMKPGEQDRDAPVTVAPSDASDKGFTLASANTAVATVVGNRIHAVAAGSAVFTATSTYSSTKTVSFLVTVNVPLISLTVADFTMKIADLPRDPVITWNPSNASNKSYVLVSNNTGIAVISSNKVKPVAAGITRIIATAADGNKVDTCTVTVIIPVEGISAGDMTMNEGGRADPPSLTWTPANATNKNYILTSYDAGVVAITADGQVRPVNRGTTTVRVQSAEDKTIEDTFTVQVRGQFGGGGF